MCPHILTLKKYGKSWFGRPTFQPAGASDHQTIWTIWDKFAKWVHQNYLDNYHQAIWEKRVRQNYLDNYYQTIWRKKTSSSKLFAQLSPNNMRKADLSQKIFEQSETCFLNFLCVFFQPVATKKGDLAKLLQIGFCKLSECGTNMGRKLNRASTQKTKKCNFNVEQTIVSEWSEKWQISWWGVYLADVPAVLFSYL